MDKYDHMSEVQRKLLAKGIIDISEWVDNDMALYVREALIRLGLDGCPDIVVRSTSNGGGCMAGFGIYDLLSQYPGKITGVVTGFANSMASIVLQACDIRQATEHSRFFIHYPLQNDVTRKQRKDPKERAKFNKNADKLDEKMIGVYLARTNLSRKKIQQLLWDEPELSAEEALAVGLIDEIIKPDRSGMRRKR